MKKFQSLHVLLLLSFLPGLVFADSNNTRLATVLPDQEIHSRFGRSVAFAGNLDGDQYEDILVGLNRGAQYIVEARAAKDLRVLCRLQGDRAHDLFGYDMASLGDLDGDGKDDFIVGAPYAGFDDDPDFGNHKRRGEARVYSGRTCQPLFPAFVGEQAGQELGFQVGPAGDANGDGINDFYISSPRYNQSDRYEQQEVGRVTIYSGHNGGIIAERFGTQRKEFFGRCVSDNARDLNGDGVPEITIGSKGFDANGMSDVGYVGIHRADDLHMMHGYHGHFENERLCESGIVKTPGIDSFWLISEGDDEFEMYEYRPLRSPRRLYRKEFGETHLQAAEIGDVDWDGRVDMLIGAPLLDRGNLQDAGKVFALSGRTQEFLWTRVGGNSGVKLGWRLAGLGRFNDDDAGGQQIKDVLIGATGAAPEGTAAGAVLVESGTRIANHEASWGEYPGIEECGYGTIALNRTPAVGRHFTFQLDDAAPYVIGRLYAGPLLREPIDLGFGCKLTIDPERLTLISDIRTDSIGKDQIIEKMPYHQKIAEENLPFGVQAYIVDPNASGGLSVSNGLVLQGGFE